MKNKRTCDYIAEAIQNEILSGRMEAGQPLRQEELSEKLGYSRMPVREALQILEEQGLVRRLATDRKSTRLNSSHTDSSRMPSSA